MSDEDLVSDAEGPSIRQPFPVAVADAPTRERVLAIPRPLRGALPRGRPVEEVPRRKCRQEIRRLEANVETCRTQHVAIAKRWNVTRLRAQTHLAPLVGQERRGNKRKRAGETQRWRSDSVVYAGFQRLGGLQSDKVRTTHGRNSV